MNVERFLGELPALFEDFPRSPTPVDRSLLSVCDAVDGLSEENNLALLALAGRHLAVGESYLEAGVYHGRTLAGVAVGSSAACVAMDDFSYEGASRDGLALNLARFSLDDRVLVLEGDTVELLERERLPVIGVFFYDAEHTTEATLAALRSVTRHLASRALIVIDDSDWDEVRLASDEFVSESACATLRMRLEGRAAAQPWWWDGMDIIEWSDLSPSTRANSRIPYVAIE